MKKEILCIRNFNMKYSSAVHLEDISLCLMEGESTGFLGLTSSGKDALLQVLCGNEWSGKGTIVVDGVHIAHPDEMKKKVHRIIDINYAISDWTVVEYIGLVTKRFRPMVFHDTELKKEIEQFLARLALDIDVGKKLADLSELEKRLIDLVKAYRKQVGILIIEDEFEGVTTEEIKMFKSVMSRVIKGRMTAIINTHSDNFNQILSDNYIIFKNGHIIKKCKKAQIKDNIQLEAILLGTSYSARKKHLESCSIGNSYKYNERYAAKNIMLKNGKRRDLVFGRGEIVTLLTLDRKEKARVFGILSGREVNKNVTLSLDTVPCNHNNVSDFVRNKIVSGVHLGTAEELLPKMSVGENILIPSLGKIPSIDYINNGSKMAKIIEKEIVGNMVSEGIMNEKETNDRILIILERWFIYKPKVLVLLEPFIQCDVCGVLLIKSYINRFSAMGTTVIIIKSRENDVSDISNRIISIG